MKEKGQGLVEFAIIVPFLIALSIAIIYLGALFLDYTQYNNAARDAARDISLQAGTESNAATLRNSIVKSIKEQDPTTLAKYATPMTSLYKATWSVIFYNGTSTQSTATNATDVEVTINLHLDKQAGGLLAEWGVLPSDLKPITFRMALEKSMIIYK